MFDKKGICMIIYRQHFLRGWISVCVAALFLKSEKMLLAKTTPFPARIGYAGEPCFHLAVKARERENSPNKHFAMSLRTGRAIEKATCCIPVNLLYWDAEKGLFLHN